MDWDTRVWLINVYFIMAFGSRAEQHALAREIRAELRRCDRELVREIRAELRAYR